MELEPNPPSSPPTTASAEPTPPADHDTPSAGSPRAPRVLSNGPVLFAGVVIVALAVVIAVMFVTNGRGSTSSVKLIPTVASNPNLSGIDLHGLAAPAFQLTNEHGKSISLASERGHVVVLTFLDSTGADQCTSTGKFLGQVATTLGAQASNVTWLAVSVNANDTAANFAQCVRQGHITVPLDLLMGTDKQITPVLEAYHVATTPSKTDVQHTSGLFVIDANGHEIEYADGQVTAANVGHDVLGVLNGTIK